MKFIIPFAVVTAAVALVPPLRERVVPVAKAMGKAGTGVAGATFGGAAGIAKAFIHPGAETTETAKPSKVTKTRAA